jgi:hypothetical protein
MTTGEHKTVFSLGLNSREKKIIHCFDHCTVGANSNWFYCNASPIAAYCLGGGGDSIQLGAVISCKKGLQTK